MIEQAALAFGLVLARVAAFVAALPILDAARAPRLVKAGFALALAVFYLLRHSSPLSAPSLAGEVSWLTCGLALGREAALGALLGYAMGLVLMPVQVAGHYLGQEMGLSAAQLTGLVSSDASTAVSTAFEALATLLLLGLDGHHLFLGALHGTFDRFPPGAAFSPPPADGLVAGLTRAQQWGLLLAAPVGAALFTTSVALALVNRAVPQLNLQSVGLGLRVGVGLAGLFVLFPDFVRAAAHTFGMAGDLLRGVP